MKSNAQESDHMNFKSALNLYMRNMVPRKRKLLAQDPKANIWENLSLSLSLLTTNCCTILGSCTIARSELNISIRDVKISQF